MFQDKSDHKYGKLIKSYSILQTTSQYDGKGDTSLHHSTLEAKTK